MDSEGYCELNLASGWKGVRMRYYVTDAQDITVKQAQNC